MVCEVQNQTIMDMQVVDVEKKNKYYIITIMKHVQVQIGYIITILSGY